MELEIANRIEDVAPSKWNSAVRAAGGTIFQSHQWLRAYEEGYPDIEPYHVLVYDDSELVAACPTYLETRDEWLSDYGDIPPVLLSHSFQAWYSDILGNPDEQVTTVILDTIEDIAENCGAEAVGFGAIPEGESELRGTLKSTDYTVIQHNCSMVLEVPSSYDAYMESLDGNHRRDSRRRVRRDREEGVTAEAVDEVDFDLFRSLCYEVFEKHGDYEKRFSTDFLRGILTYLEDEVTYMVIKSPEDEIISAFLMLESGDSLYPWIAGIDYDYTDAHDPSIFFYHAVVEYALERGISRIDVGRGVIDFKRKFGYEPRLTYLALKSPEVDLRLEESFPEAEIHDGQEIRSCC